MAFRREIRIRLSALVESRVVLVHLEKGGELQTIRLKQDLAPVTNRPTPMEERR